MCFVTGATGCMQDLDYTYKDFPLLILATPDSSPILMEFYSSGEGSKAAHHRYELNIFEKSIGVHEN